MNFKGEMAFLSEPYAASGRTGQIWVLAAVVLGGPEIIHYGADGGFSNEQITGAVAELSEQAFNRLGWVKDARARCGWSIHSRAAFGDERPMKLLPM